HKIDKLPEQLKPLVSVVIDRGDYHAPAPAFSFKIDAEAEVFIAVHDRGKCSLPEGWKKTDMKVAWGGQYTDTVYSRTFKAGAVKIPGHDGKEGPNYGLPHMAFVKPLTGKVNVTQADD
ncbi:MAG: hypothetical protein ACYTGB_19590, partial [Planctomycetota bacterium]